MGAGRALGDEATFMRRSSRSFRSNALTLLALPTVVAAVVALAPIGAMSLTLRQCECATSPDFGVPGSTLTLGFRIEAEPGEAIFGLGASVYGYNESVIDFVSGEAVGSIFHGVAIPAVGAFEGLNNSLIPGGPLFRTGPLSESSVGASGNRVLIFNGIGLNGRTFNPLDPGLDGVIGGGGAQVRVTFQITGAGSANLIIGTGYNGDGVVLAGGIVDTSFNLQIPIGGLVGLGPDCILTPEPSTALLAGLGLSLLALGRPRPRTLDPTRTLGPAS